MATVEELESQLAAHQTASKSEIDAAKARIAEINAEAKGHRLNSDRHKADAESAQKARDEAIAEAARIKSELESQKLEAVKAAETKATEATAKAQQRAINADLKVAAKDAGAHDTGDILALVDRSKIKLDENGDISNADELLADLKKAKPHLFGTAAKTTSSTATPPPAKQAAAKSALDMTDEEFEAARRNHAWRK
jgi:hypothetical protein